MCVFSMIGDHYHEKWKDYPMQPLTNVTGTFMPFATQAELAELRRDVLEMKELLKRAIKYDAENGQPGCEMEEKIATLRKVAELVGVSLEDVLARKAAP